MYEYEIELVRIQRVAISVEANSADEAERQAIDRGNGLWARGKPPVDWAEDGYIDTLNAEFVGDIPDEEE